MPPTPEEDASADLEPELLAALRARTSPEGFLPFDAFWDVALYGEHVGYYRRARSPFGPTGDYYTAPGVHPLFARSLAARLERVRELLDRPDPFRVVDLGAGDGTLLAGIVTALGARGASEGVEAVVVDRSPELRSSARSRVADAARGPGVAVRAASSLAELGPISGAVVANELLDAMPARRLRWTGSDWTELGLRWDGGRLEPDEASVDRPLPPPPLPPLGPDDTGTVLEVTPAAEAIVRELADHLVEGLVVIADFGAEERELVAAHRRGTAAAVQRHRALPSVSVAPGRSDVSVWVNFTRIRCAAAAAGLVELAYRSQAEALGAWGFARELDRAVAETRSAEEAVRLHLAAKNLLFGFGTFHVLELAPPGTARRAGPLREAERATPS